MNFGEGGCFVCHTVWLYGLKGLKGRRGVANTRLSPRAPPNGGGVHSILNLLVEKVKMLYENKLINF